MRTQKSLKNFIYGTVAQAVSSLINFTIRFVLIRTLGIEAVSLNGLFTEVIAVLSLAEMGAGTVIVYHLYAPLREENEKRLAQLMNLFRTTYRITALAVFVLGMVLLPFVHLLISRMEIQLWYLRTVYFLFLVQTASSYLLSYKACLLNADQKGYLISKCTLFVRAASGGGSILFLLLTENYIVYLLIQILTTVINNLIISILADRQYPFLKGKDRLPAKEKREIFSNIKYLFVDVLSGKIINSTDNILISTMAGTLQVGAYSCYTMIIHALNSLLIQIYHATMGGIGNLVAEGDNCHTETVLRRLTFITYCPAVFSAVGIYTVSSSFIRLLYGEEFLLPMSVVFVCAINFLIYLIKNPLWQVMAVSGMFARNKNISLLGGILNLLVSIILGKRLGIMGILLGTTGTLLVQSILKAYFLFHEFLHLDDRAYIKLIIKETGIGIFCMLIAQGVCKALPVSNQYVQILGYGICSEILTVGINILAFHKTPEFKYVVEMGRRVCSDRKRDGRTIKW